MTDLKKKLLELHEGHCDSFYDIENGARVCSVAEVIEEAAKLGAAERERQIVEDILGVALDWRAFGGHEGLVKYYGADYLVSRIKNR